MEWTVKLTAYYQSATVTYDRANGSIVDVKATPTTGPRELVPLSAADCKTVRPGAKPLASKHHVPT